VSLETPNNTLVFGLDMCSKVWFKVFNSNILKVGRDDMARKVILEEKYFSFFFTKFLISTLKPFLIELDSHPGFCIISVIKP
jgi:hypothetical protein